MKRLTDEEKKQLGFIIHYYRSQYFKSDTKFAEQYKQINFCKDICSQAQLSRLEHGDAIKNQEIYEQLLDKLNLSLEKLSSKDLLVFDTYFENILTYQNDDQLIINYNEYVLFINKSQNIFKKNIIYTHYNYALEFIITIINEDVEEASFLLDYVENILDILPPTYMVLTLQYLGNFYQLKNDFSTANKFYLLSIEHMHKFNLNNPIIYVEIAYNYINLHKYIYALDYIHKALDIFIDTHNYEILERIHRCITYIYLINRYYDDGLNILNKTIKYAEKTNKKHILSSDYALLAIVFYFKHDYSKALEYIQTAIKLKENEGFSLIKCIIELKLEIRGDYHFENKQYQFIKDIYQNGLDEEVFEKEIEPMLQCSNMINLLLIRDSYLLYKENKKYKKALELFEQYHF